MKLSDANWLLVAILAITAGLGCRKEKAIAEIPSLRVYAGNDTVIHAPSNSITLKATFSKSVTDVKWRKIAGSGGVIVAPGSGSTLVTTLYSGIHSFEVEATDEILNKAKDTVSVTVRDTSKHFVYQFPEYQLLALPVNSATLKATAYNPPMAPISPLAIMWTKLSGPGASVIQSPTTETTLVTNLQPGVHRFQSKITNIDNYSDSSVATVAVYDPATPNTEVVVPNQAWINQPNHMWEYIILDIYTHIPVGRALQKIFIRTDCSTAWTELLLLPPATYPEWSYTVFSRGNQVWIEQPWNYPCIGDTPDLKLVY